MAVPMPNLTNQTSSSASLLGGSFATGPKNIAAPGSSGLGGDLVQQITIGVVVALLVGLILKGAK